VAWILSGHNLPTDRTRELFKRSEEEEEEESLLGLILKIGNFWISTVLVGYHDWGRSGDSSMMLGGYEKKIHVVM